jgi:tryptophan synthase alpha subunit
MSRIDERFAACRAAGRPAFVAYLTAGDPSAARTVAACLELERGGADVIELGVPFSDPIADGPVIQRASERALARGTTLAQVLDMVREARAAGLGVPVVLFSYLNPLLRFGLRELPAAARAAGCDGALVTDLPIDGFRRSGDPSAGPRDWAEEVSDDAQRPERRDSLPARAAVDATSRTDAPPPPNADLAARARASLALGPSGATSRTDAPPPPNPQGIPGEWIAACRSAELDTVFLAAPTSPPARLEAIAAASRGFVYAVSRTGVTGEQVALSDDARPLVERLRAGGKPVALGFGIATPEQVAAAGAVADGVVVGSALVRFLEEHPEGDLAERVRWLRSALENSR